ncbi:MAG TPA: hypothetical protein VJ850_12470 [Candidatus Limnocylindrales bacterium]|nr:hypothetical protein [Candidatus Limnocylindrales bacterium]
MALGRWIARNSGWLVAVLAVLGLLSAAYVLASGPFALPTDLADRAPISGSVGGLFALLAAIVAISTASWINSSDFKAEQEVKADSSRLRASLRMILIKGAGLTASGVSRDPAEVFDKELETISAFVNSTTGFGYWSHVEKRSEQKEKGGGGGEDWRIFFLYVAQLLDCASDKDRLGTLLHSAAWLDALLADMTTADIDAISRYVADLTGALGKAEASKDTLLAGMAKTYGRGSKFDPFANAKRPS